MSTRFLAQLAHRALAGTDVRPRIAARFESIAPLEHSGERTSDAPATRSELSRPPPAAEAPAPGVHTPLAPPPDAPAPSKHTITRTEFIDRVSTREVPVLIEPDARPAPPAALEAHPHDRGDIPAPRPAPPPLERPAAPLLARAEPVPAAKPREIAPEAILAPVASTPPRATTPPAALLIPGAPPAAADVASARARPQVTPAPAPIEIVIGRIEIRSDTAAPAPRAPVPAPRRAAMSLDDYLRKREGER